MFQNILVRFVVAVILWYFFIHTFETDLKKIGIIILVDVHFCIPDASSESQQISEIAKRKEH